jgi:diketogulonate reductase-like aldo/keto reductase
LETITTQGVAMPRLGFGTFRMPGAAAQPVVESERAQEGTLDAVAAAPTRIDAAPSRSVSG